MYLLDSAGERRPPLWENDQRSRLRLSPLIETLDNMVLH
jgi:hypothetical protein